MLYWYLTGRDCSAVPMQQAQMGVLSYVAAALYQAKTGALHIGVLTPERGELETVRLFTAKLSWLDPCYKCDKRWCNVGYCFGPLQTLIAKNRPNI